DARCPPAKDLTCRTNPCEGRARCAIPWRATRPPEYSRSRACECRPRTPRLPQSCTRRRSLRRRARGGRHRGLGAAGSQPSATRTPGPCSSRSPDGHLIDADGRDAYSHGHTLPILPADADSLVEAQIVADAAHVLQCPRAIADECCVPDRTAEFSILNEVAFR